MGAARFEMTITARIGEQLLQFVVLEQPHPIRIDVHAVPPAVLPRYRLSQPLRSPGDRVLVDVVMNRPPGRLLQQLRGSEIRKPLSQVDGAVLLGHPSHSSDDRFSETVRAAGGGHGATGSWWW